MYHQECHKKSQETIILARVQYSYLFDSELSEESIETRYYLLNYLFSEYHFEWRLEKNENGKPIPIKMSWWLLLYWSISHSNKSVAFIVSDRPTGIDIMEYEERNISVLDVHHSNEYDILEKKDWYQFYFLWTAKESIIKLVWWTLDDMPRITLEQKITPTVFEYWYNNQNYWVYSTQDNDTFISYIIS